MDCARGVNVFVNVSRYGCYRSPPIASKFPWPKPLHSTTKQVSTPRSISQVTKPRRSIT